MPSRTRLADPENVRSATEDLRYRVGDGNPVRREFREVHGKGAQSAQRTHNALLRAGDLREGRLVQVAPEQKVNETDMFVHSTQVSRARSARVFSSRAANSRDFSRLEIVLTLCAVEVTSLSCRSERQRAALSRSADKLSEVSTRNSCTADHYFVPVFSASEVIGPSP